MATPCCISGKLTVAELKSVYLLGIPLETDKGEPLEDSSLEFFIDAAYERVSELNNIQILPKQLVENQDLYMDQANRSYFMFHTDRVPILFDDEHRDTWPMKIWAFYGADITPAEFPNNWFRVNKKAGSVIVYPTFGNMGSFLHQFTAIQSSLGLYRRDYVPQYYKIEYWAGFCPIPRFINDIVAKIASINIMAIAGDLAYGLGLSSYSVSLDGLSQSISTIRSSQGNLLAPRIAKYEKDLEKDLILLQSSYGFVGLAGV